MTQVELRTLTLSKQGLSSQVILRQVMPSPEKSFGHEPQVKPTQQQIRNLTQI